MRIKIDDSVKVRNGIMCPDDDSLCIGGWQGRVFEIDEAVGIRWDSITLKQIPHKYIRQSEEDGLDWAEMYLETDEIESAPARDTEEEADNVREKMESTFFWLSEGKEGERILKVIANADDEVEAWHGYLTQTLKFPFEAKVSEPQDKGQLNQGDVVQIQNIGEADEHYGVLAEVVYDRKKLVFPMCDLTAKDKQSPNYLPLKDYCVWFANR